MSILDKLQVSAEDAPSAIGPYSQAVIIGNLVYTSGQVALDPKTGQLVEGGVKEQTVRVLENLKAVLAEAGSSLHQAGKQDIRDLKRMCENRERNSRSLHYASLRSG